MNLEDVTREALLFKQYMKDWADMYVEFCIKSNNGWDKIIFKEYFTFEKWKKGFTECNTSMSGKLVMNKNGESFPDYNGYIRVKYNIFHFKPFNIRYSIDDYYNRVNIK